MVTLIERLSQALEDSGFDVSIWKGRRIYFKGLGRDIAAYIEPDEPEKEATLEMALYEGCCLKVFSNCETQGRQWQINRAKQVKHELMLKMYAAKIVDCKPCEKWEDVILT